jgi:ankyrin repeat protein
VACERGKLETMKFLVSMDMRPQEDLYFYFLIACENGRVDIVEYLVTLGFDPKKNTEDVLLNLCRRGRLPMVQFLVKHGVKISNDNFIAACTWGNLEVAQFIEQMGYADYPTAVEMNTSK